MNGSLDRRLRARGGRAGARERGFNLLEVMIAVVVVTIGLLGLAAMESLALRRTNDAALRGIATLQAHDMAGRMAANITGVADGNYNAISGVGSNPPDCTTKAAPTFCNPAEIAQVDQFEWNTANANLLPCGIGTVADPESDGIFTITVSWMEFEPGAGPGSCADRNKSFIYEVDPL